MTRHGRDLSGFQSTPPTDTDAFRPPTDRPAEERARITLSIPVDIAQTLRSKSESDGLYYIDIIGAAFSAHRAGVEADYGRKAPVSPLGGSPLRRRQPPGRVQIALVLSSDGLAELDRAAGAVELDRSSYVSELLVRHLT
jgi:hypothetical protein